MKKIIAVALLSIVALSQPAFAVPPAKAAPQKIIMLTPGQEREARFYLDGAIERATLSPAAFFPVLLLGPAGSFSAELVIDPEGDLDLAFTDEIKGMLLGAAFSTAHPFSFHAGQSIELPVEATFGFALIGAFITTIDTEDNLDDAIPCSITFALTEQEAETEAGRKP
jgi:hypothetical protein